MNGDGNGGGGGGHGGGAGNGGEDQASGNYETWEDEYDKRCTRMEIMSNRIRRTITTKCMTKNILISQSHSYPTACSLIILAIVIV